MKFRFTHHAQYRMEKRRILASDIKYVINNPDFSRVEEGGIIVSTGNVKGKDKLGVVYRRLKNGFLIVTVYYEK